MTGAHAPTSFASLVVEMSDCAMANATAKRVRKYTTRPPHRTDP
ncbi:hypothetical protein AKJ09_01608 [Labilithrix luteola]|uniref:Uncharacterized protein n=1 Tax=Labilithrix luteola TaxID=1391654 RepID=A0A0K1PP94_9BACT|nr:hypothetical protein AKJ09_01608 [Labilithrix luteola]